MTCDNVADLLVDAVLNELDPTAAQELNAHLANCRACAADAEALRALWADLGQITVPTPSAEAGVRLGRALVQRSHGSPWRPVLRAALVVLAVGGGMALGRWGLPVPESAVATDTLRQGSTFLLLIRGDEPGRRLPEAQLVGEYRAWAATLRREGRLVSAEKLTDDPGRWLTGADSTTAVSGFFVIVAADYDEAERIARGSPHVAYGGTIEVRAVDRP